MKYYPMKFIREDPAVGNADSAADAKESVQLLEMRVAALREQLVELGDGRQPLRRADTLVALGRLLIRLEKMLEAWEVAHEAFELYAAEQAWEGAVQACDILFLTERPGSLAALANGVWLAVTFPVDPELSVAMLQHIVDETPPDSDGAAVAAAAALYVVDLRAQGPQREDLLIYTNQLLSTVARRHSQTESQEDFDRWFREMELDEPARFLPRLAMVLEAIVQDNWWVDRDALRARLPVQ
jgi:hypothetical protein